MHDSLDQAADATGRVAAAKFEAEFGAEKSAEVQPKTLEAQKAKKDKKHVAGMVTELVKQHAADLARFEMKLHAVDAASRLAAAKAKKARQSVRSSMRLMWRKKQVVRECRLRGNRFAGIAAEG